MNGAFRHLHMPAELTCEFLAFFSRMEYALKATNYAAENEGKVTKLWDRFANAIGEDLDKSLTINSPPLLTMF